MKTTETINMALTVHRVNDLEHNLLTDQHWEVTDSILSLSNFQEFPMHFFGNPEELIVRFCVWNFDLPLCVVPQVFHFPELIVWCAEHFSLESKSVVSKHSQIVLQISKESITKMLGLNGSGFSNKTLLPYLKMCWFKSSFHWGWHSPCEMPKNNAD